MVAVPGFAKEAVEAQAAYERAWRRSLKGVEAALASGEMHLGEMVERVAREQKVSQTVVLTAVSLLLRRRQLQERRPDFVAWA